MVKERGFAGFGFVGFDQSHRNGSRGGRLAFEGLNDEVRSGGCHFFGVNLQQADGKRMHQIVAAIGVGDDAEVRGNADAEFKNRAGRIAVEHIVKHEQSIRTIP